MPHQGKFIYIAHFPQKEIRNTDVGVGDEKRDVSEDLRFTG